MKPLSALLAIPLLATSGCGTVMLTPPPAPAPSMPPQGDLPPEPGPEKGGSRVLVMTDVPARVFLAEDGLVTTRDGATVFIEAGTLLCTSTPCSLTLPHGDYRIAFRGRRDSDRESTITVSVSRPTEVVNHTLGTNAVSVGRKVGLVFTMLGVVGLGVAAGITQGDRRSSTTVVKTIALGGTASAVFGGALFIASPTFRQEGSTTQWAPAPTGRTFATGLGLRF